MTTVVISDDNINYHVLGVLYYIILYYEVLNIFLLSFVIALFS